MIKGPGDSTAFVHNPSLQRKNGFIEKVGGPLSKWATCMNSTNDYWYTTTWRIPPSILYRNYHLPAGDHGRRARQIAMPKGARRFSSRIVPSDGVHDLHEPTLEVHRISDQDAQSSRCEADIISCFIWVSRHGLDVTMTPLDITRRYGTVRSLLSLAE